MCPCKTASRVGNRVGRHLAGRGVLLLTVAHTVREELEDGALVDVIRIISARRATRKRDDAMKTRMVSYTLDKLPPFTKARRAKLKALAARPDSEIDTSDIPK